MGFSLAELKAMVADPAEFAGRAEAQTEEFLIEEVEPRLAGYRELLKEEEVESNLQV